MVISCTPNPMPAMQRQRFKACPVCWNAMMTVQAAYQTRDQVNVAFRPQRSAAWPSSTTPAHNPAKVANTKVPNPATRIDFSAAKTPRDCGVNNAELTIPGAT